MKKWALVLVAAALIAFIAHPPMWIVHPGWKYKPNYPPSWEDIQRLVKANALWEEYQKGGQYLQAIQSGATRYPRAHDPTSDARVINAIGARVTVDFLHTLTPAQVEMLKDKLPFSKLTPDQQKILYLGPGYHYWQEKEMSHKNAGANIQNSYIKVIVRKFGIQDPYADFFWYTKAADGQELLIDDGCNNFWLKDVAKWQKPWN